MLSGDSIEVVLRVYRPERVALVELLDALCPDEWSFPTECPAYTLKGIALHILGDDLSLLSRQRDQAIDGVALMAEESPDEGFRTLLDTFNNQWVFASRFLSPRLLNELLRLTGEWTATYYEGVDPSSPGEPVGLFGAPRGSTSPFWQAIAREYLERWIHHSQIRRALGKNSLAEQPFLRVGIEVVAAMTRVDPSIPANPEDPWSLGPVVLGPAQQTADILTRGHTSAEIHELVDGPSDRVEVLAAGLGRP